MQIAIDVAGFSAAEADQLRQAMGSKRSRERMEQLAGRFYAGMAERGIVGDVADQIFDKLAAFASYGFPESHSVSFAYLVYSSSWLKYHYPAAFCAGLLRAQPMGFYSPHSLVRDARRHGVVVRRPDINRSGARADLEEEVGSTGGVALRLGLDSVRHVGDELAATLAAAGPYRRIEEVARVPGVRRNVMEALATAGAFRGLDPDSRHGRREDLWSAGAAAQGGPDRLEGMVTGLDAPMLPGMSPLEEAASDLWATGIAADGHPTRFVRDRLEARGVIPTSRLGSVEADRNVTVAGVVTHRQRPMTAGGITFINLEDETGFVNVICSPGCWERHRSVVRSSPALLVTGRLERQDGVVNVVAQRIEALRIMEGSMSRDFR
jgi:error-prone DNA polymerase